MNPLDTTLAHEAQAEDSTSKLALLRPALLAAALGIFILLGVGFAQPQAIHDAAHDARHIFSFPCH